MKRVLALTMVTLSAQLQSCEGLSQEGASPDPAIVAPMNSRFVGKINAVVTGSGQNQTFDFDTMLEFREKQGGKLIGYTRAWDKLQNGKLIIDFWAQGQRQNADIELNIPNPNPACDDIVLRGKLDALGNVSVANTTQKLNCRIFFGVSIEVNTQATVFIRQGDAVWSHWNKIEEHFASK
jgi:hypothetical protein